MEDKPCLLPHRREGVQEASWGEPGAAVTPGAVWDTKDMGTQAPMARGTHCDAAFVVDELAEVFIQVRLVLLDIGQQHRQLLLKTQHLLRDLWPHP